MKARIYQPSKSAMQSGKARTRQWLLKFEPTVAKSVDPLMGWTGTEDMEQQVSLSFDTLEDAESYAKRKGIDYEVKPLHKPKRRVQAYADNFK